MRSCDVGARFLRHLNRDGLRRVVSKDVDDLDHDLILTDLGIIVLG